MFAQMKHLFQGVSHCLAIPVPSDHGDTERSKTVYQIVWCNGQTIWERVSLWERCHVYWPGKC